MRRARRDFLAGVAGAAGAAPAAGCADAFARSESPSAAQDATGGSPPVKLTLEADKREWRAGEAVTVRLVAYNEAYEPVELDRRLLVGPNPVPERAGGPPVPVSLEPAARRKEQNQVLLNPWCLYGRQRVFDSFPAGKVTVYGYLLRRDSGTPTPKGPSDAAAVLVAAEPLELTIV